MAITPGSSPLWLPAQTRIALMAEPFTQGELLAAVREAYVMDLIDAEQMEEDIDRVLYGREPSYVRVERPHREPRMRTIMR